MTSKIVSLCQDLSLVQVELASNGFDWLMFKTRPGTR